MCLLITLPWLFSVLFRMEVKKLQKPTGQLLAAMQVNIYELYTT